MTTNQLDPLLVSKAVSAIFDFEDKKNREKGKRAVAKPILAQVQLKATVKKSIVRPVRVKVPHSLVTDDDDGYSVCLFCKNEEKESIDSYLSKNPVKGLSKVLSLADVKKLYAASKEKKMLLAEYSHFICDTSILSLLHKMMGKTFAERTNCPIQVSYTSPERIESAMVKVLSSSYMHIKGKTVTIRLGLTSMSEEEVTENTLEGLVFAIAKFKNTWSNIHSIHIKTADSPSLPIYSKAPSEVIKYIKLKANIVDEEPLKKLKNIVRKDDSDKITNADEDTSTDLKRKSGVLSQTDGLSASDAALVRPKGIKRIKCSLIKR